MHFLRWIPFAVAMPLLAQMPDYFPEDKSAWWQPKWELRMQADRISKELTENSDFDLRRVGAQLRLRWEGNWDHIGYQFGTRSAVGSDGNRFNIPRWDQQPSNGSQLDVAHVNLSTQTQNAFGELRMGFQESSLLSPEALWDRDLRFLGGSLRAGLRSPGGLLQEAGLRLASGRVRTVQNGDVDLTAGQAVLKLEAGILSCTAHAGRWELHWQRGFARRRPVPGHEAQERQRLILNAYGLTVLWNKFLPVEIKAFGQQNPDTHEGGAEFEASLGGVERPFWPRISFVWQRFDRTGTLYPVNSDQWWYYLNARGPRYEVTFPFPGQWLLSAIYLRHRTYGTEYPAERRMITLAKRF